ncbi:MAG: LysR family transcriptional regulator [Actinomycetota bacterium]
MALQLDIESLRVLVAVVDRGGMTRAAELLGMSQSAVSWKIKRLEQRVGRDLLVRDGRSFRLSHDGAELITYARNLVDMHDEAVARLSSSDLTGRVRFGTTEEVSEFCMRNVLARFNRTHPMVNIELFVDRASQLDDRLQAGSLDVAVLQVGPEEVRATDTMLWENDLMWVSSHDWTYETGEVPLITFGEHGFYRPRAEAALVDAGVPYRVAFSGPSTSSVLSAVEFGLGVAVIGDRWVTGDLIEWPRAADLDPLPPAATVARTGRRTDSAVTRELIDEIEQELTEPI